MWKRVRLLLQTIEIYFVKDESGLATCLNHHIRQKMSEHLKR